MKAADRVRLAVSVAILAIVVGQAAVAEAQRRGPRASGQPTAQPQDDTPPVPMTDSSSQMDQMAIRVIDEKTSQPVEGANVQFTGRIGIRNAARTLRTNAEGKADLIYPKGAAIPTMRFTARKAGYVPATYIWRTTPGPIELPKDLEVKLETGTKMGGKVVDVEQKPIPGAQVRISLQNAWPANYRVFTVLTTLTSDKEGGWLFNDAPSDPSRVMVTVTHPNYINEGSSTRMLAGLENTSVLKQGISLRGTVVDKDGQPVSFARVRYGDSRSSSSRAEAATDTEGKFELKNCMPGASYVTVISDIHAPQMQQVTVADQNELLKFVLEPGNVVRARIVDPDGNPLANVNVSASMWRDMQLLDFTATTTPEGRFEWKAAPADNVRYSISRTGYMSNSDQFLAANGEEHVITMSRQLVVTGSVTDAETGEPIKNFTMQRGQSQGAGNSNYWYTGNDTAFRDGAFTYPFTSRTEGYLLRAHADGYLPGDSRVFKPEEGNVTFNFSLKKGTGPSALVLQPNGEPAVGAEVGQWRENQYIHIEQGRFGNSSSSSPIASTNKDGRFTLRPQTEAEKFLLVILHDTGYADITSPELAKAEKITLKAWGKLEGQVFEGAKPDAGRYVSFSPQRERDTNDPLRRNFWGYNYQVTTDAEGRFSFDRVIPGTGNVSKIVVTRYGNSSMHSPSGNINVNIKPGDTVKVKIGGTGRPVVGKLTTDREPDSPIGWAQNEPVSISLRNPPRGLLGAIFGQAAPAVDQNTRFAGAVDEAGKFRISDVPAGNYTLSVSVNEAPTPNGNRYNLGHTNFEFTVPPMEGERSDDPLDIGVVTVKMLEVLEPGKAAPAATVPGLDGKVIRTTEYNGKLWLLAFLAGDRGADTSKLAMLRRVHEKFGKDPNFAIVTVWCGYDQENVKQTVAGSGAKWPNAYESGIHGRLSQAYMVRTLPTVYLIGANGKVVSRNAKEEELIKSIDSFLSLGELYFLDKAEKSAAFPIKNFEQVAVTLSAPPVVVLADNAVSRSVPSAPQQDHVRLLAADGKELVSLGGFSNQQTIGGYSGLAIDRQRGRIYVRENTGRRVTALSTTGQKVWQIEGIDADCLAVDEKTGNIWISGGQQYHEGETVVLDAKGKDVSMFAYRGLDIDYSPHDDAFWLVGYEVIKLNREGKVLLRKRTGNWCNMAAAVNPADGSIWIVEAAHQGVENSKNRLWLLGPDGAVRQEIDLGENPVISVAIAGKDGSAWIGSPKVGLRRVTTDGKIGEPLPVVAHNVSVSPSSGDIWVTTKDALLKIDETGRELAKSPMGSASQQAWVVAF